MALNSSDGRVMKTLILLLFCCFCSASNSDQITCRTSLRIQYGTSYYSYKYHDVADDVHEGCCLSCENAQLLCYKNMVSHLNQVLGNGVAYIRDTAAENLCNIVKRENNNTNPMHVYAYWYVSNCASTSNIMYLGQLCCWRYYVGGKEFFVNNPQCSQCEKPDCHPDKNSTYPPMKPVATTAEPSPEAIGNFLSDMNEMQNGHKEPQFDEPQQSPVLKMMLENQEVEAQPELEETQKVQALKDMEAHFQEALEGQTIPFRSGKLRGLHRLDLNDQGMEDDQPSQMKENSLFESDFKNFMGDIQG